MAWAKDYRQNWIAETLRVFEAVVQQAAAHGEAFREELAALIRDTMGCGGSIVGANVFCDDAGLGMNGMSVCDCKKTAAAILAALSALGYAKRDEARAENTLLRAALAQSELPCVYCSLPRDEWAKCKSGFPGCARGDDAVGCPELGARLELDEANKRADASVAQQAALAEALQAIVNRWGPNWIEQTPMMLERARNALSSLSPRAKLILAVVEANAEWQRSRAPPMDVDGEREGFVELKRALDALHTSNLR